MTVYRIEHAVVMDTDDIPGRGGYAVVGISPGVSPAERSFIAGNFGISDYLHDPKTDNRIFYSSFRIPGGRHAFVRRFARGTELRRNNTQRRLVVHTLLLDDAVWNTLSALPWLLLNARLRYEGTGERLRADMPWTDDGTTLPALEWDSDDGASSNVWKRITDRIPLIAPGEPRDVLARVLTALSAKSRVLLPQDAGYEWATMLAWSMLPRRDRDEIGWTQHDSMNLSGVTFPLANGIGATTDLAQVQPARFAPELVGMNVESESSWLDFQSRTARCPLTIRNPSELEKWGEWRRRLLALYGNIHRSHDQVVTYMRDLAATIRANPRAAWIDGEEVLHLIWSTVAAASRDDAARTSVESWGDRLRQSGLDKIVFRTAPARHWLSAAGEEAGADAFLAFFLAGGGKTAEAAAAREAVAEWLIEIGLRDVSMRNATALAALLAAENSRALRRLLELLLATPEGLDAIIESVRTRQHADLMHDAAPVVLRYQHPRTIEFLRDPFVPAFTPSRVDATLAREIGNAIRNDSRLFLSFVQRLSPDVATELVSVVQRGVLSDVAWRPLAREMVAHFRNQASGLAHGGPIAIALAQAGEPAGVWFDVILGMARAIDQRNDAAAPGEFAGMLRTLAPHLDLTGAMDRFLEFVREHEPAGREAMRSVVLLLRPVWASGKSTFVSRLMLMIQRAPSVTSWEEVILAYADDHRARHLQYVSELASWFLRVVDSSQIERLSTRAGDLLELLQPEHERSLALDWAKRVGSLPPSPIAAKLLALVQRNAASYEVERDLAMRDIRLGVANERTLNRLEVALSQLNRGGAASLFIAEANVYLGNDPASRAIRLLRVLSSADTYPTVRRALLQLLPDVLKDLRSGHWTTVKDQIMDSQLLSVGVVSPLGRAAGSRASRSTRAHFARVWEANGRKDGLDALYAGSASRRFLPWTSARRG